MGKYTTMKEKAAEYETGNIRDCEDETQGTA